MDRSRTRTSVRDAAKRRRQHRALEPLEPRTLLSNLPAPFVVLDQNTQQPIRRNVSNPAGADELSVLNLDNARNESSPSIAVSPNDPNKLVAVWTQTDLLEQLPFVAVGQGAYSTDGGRTWTPLTLPKAVFSPLADPLANPADLTDNDRLPRTMDTSVAFDRNDNFYIVSVQNDAGDTDSTDSEAGAIVLHKYAFPAGAAAPTPVELDKILYAWNEDIGVAIKPTIVVDDTVPSYTDPATGAVQTNPFSGNIYVAWATINAQIKLVASSDGGQTFSARRGVSDFVPDNPLTGGGGGANFGNSLHTSPRMTVSQGTADGRVQPGQVTVIWDDFGRGGNVSTIMADSFVGAVSQSFAAATGVIANATNTGPRINRFPIRVNISDTRFNTVTDIDLRLSLLNPSGGISDLTVNLIAPDGKRLPLFNGLNGPSVGVGGGGTIFGATFDQEATQGIAGADQPYIGHYKPAFQPPPPPNVADTTFNFSDYYGLLPSQVNGVWTLEIVDNSTGGFDDSNPPRLVDAALIVTSRANPGTNLNGRAGDDIVITTTNALGLLEGPYPVLVDAAFAAVFDRGINSGATIASDNTLGSFRSETQGRLYVAFTDFYRFAASLTGVINTDVFLAFSDDGGLTWNRHGATLANPKGLPVNDDISSRVDGFTTSRLDPENGTAIGRPQFAPEIAVDQTTGTLAVSFYDARHDAQEIRVARTVTTSIDGGRTFSPQLFSFANAANAPLDVIERRNVVLGPIPDNLTEGLPDGAPTLRLAPEDDYGFGDRQGLVFTNGRIYVAWSGNENGGPQGLSTLDVRVAQMATATGPRVIRSTMGQVTTTDSTGTPRAEGFFLEFDRPVDVRTFTAADVQVRYLAPGAPSGSFTLIPVLAPVPQNLSGPVVPGIGQIRATIFYVPFATLQMAVGTYSYSVGPDIRDFGTGTTTSITPSNTNTFTAGTSTPFNARIGPISIPDNNPAGASAVVRISDIPSDITLADLNVRVSITHPNPAQLRLELRGPNGTTILLSQGNGAGGANYTGTIFDDQAANSIISATPPFTGSFRPQGLLSTFNGISPNGDWTLVVTDLVGGSVGTIDEFVLTVGTGATYGSLGLDTIDGGKVVAPLQVTSVPSGDLLIDVNVTLAVTHPNVSELLPTLIAPNGTRITIPTTTLNGLPFSLATLLTPEQIGALPGNGTWLFEIIDPAGGASGGQITDFELAFRTERTYNAGDTPVSVAPNATNSSLIPVNLPPTILLDDVDVLLSASSFNARDIILTLVKQDINGVEQARILLANRRGTGNVAGFAYRNTLFDQAAATSITAGTVPFTGTFRPEGNLNNLNGLQGAGSWFLEVENRSLSRTAVINDFRITLRSSSITGRADDLAGGAVTGVPIPERGLATATTTVNTAPGGGTISDLNVNLSIQHPRTQDLDIYLVGPGGQRVPLSRGNPVIPPLPAPPPPNANYTGTIFDDEAPIAITSPAAVAPFTGRFRPEQSLSIFDGTDANGTWTLEVVDRVSGIAGTITDFSLDIATRTTIGTNTTVTLPDNSTRFSSINVSTLPFGSRIRDVNVSINIAHTNVGDLVVDLISPAGTIVRLATNRGGTGDNYTGTEFDDSPDRLVGNPPAPPGPIGGGTAPFTNVFRTDAFATNAIGLAAFNGEQGNGTWRLRVQDTNGNSIGGSIGAWSLNIETALAYGDTPMESPLTLTRNTTSTTATVAIPDTNTPASSPINITSFPLGSLIRDVNVTLNINHPNVGDLVIDLVSPAGTTINLASNLGDTGDNYTNTTFDDQALLPITLIAPPFTGTFRPQQPLSAFNGEQANGTWQLRVRDTNGNALTGSIGAWSIDIETYVVNSAAAVVEVAGLPATDSIVDLKVQISIDHPTPEDLTLLLIAPDGTTALLASGQGGTTSNAYTNTVFDDQAADDIFGHPGPFTGSFRPEDSLVIFNGKNPNGRWKLLVAHADNTAPATIREFALSFRSETTYGALPAQATIPDPGIVVVPLTVSGINPTNVLADLDVTVSIQHPNVGDLNLTLIAPDGTRIDLSSGNGGTGANYINTTFDDQSQILISATPPPLPAPQIPSPPFTGRFRPEQPLDLLKGLPGSILNGQWKLEVRDTTANNIGVVTDFQIGLLTAPTFVPTASLPLPLADNTTQTLIIPVSGLPAGDLTADVELNLTIEHPDVSELRIALQSPDGTRVPLVLIPPPPPPAPAPPAGLTGANLTNTTFDDEAPTFINAATAPFTGRFRPMTTMSALYGRVANGNWRLIIEDTAGGGQTGIIQNVRLIVLSETAASTLPLPVRELSTSTSALLVDSFPPNEVITSVRVFVDLQHPSADGVSFALIAPNGTRVELSSGNGGRDANGVPLPNYTGTIFDDQAPQSVLGALAPFNGSFRPEQALARLNGLSPNGIWRLEVTDNRLQYPNQAPLQPGPDGEGLLTGFSLEITTGSRTVTQTIAGNPMDQDADGINIDTDAAEAANDTYATPRSLIGQPFTQAYDPLTLPLIVPGPRVINSFVEGVIDTIDNLVTDRTVSSMVVEFDRNMNPATFTAVDVLRLEGPSGVITGAVAAGPFGVQPINARQFRITFPTQQLSGTYTILLGADIESATGEKMDVNRNAGLEFLRGETDAGTTRIAFESTTDVPIPAAPSPSVPSVVESVIDLTNNIDFQFAIADLDVRINITFPSAPNLRVELIAEGSGQTILLVDQIGQTGTRADFFDTIFNDQAVTPIQNGGPPFQGEYNPQVGLGGQPLSDLNGFQANQRYILRVTNFSSNPANTGLIDEWELIFQKPVPFSGLGEPVADRSTASFRIFTMDPTNPLASTVWTPVGPAGVSSPDRAGAGLNAEVAGRVNELAVDPSDPSGNTVYAASASGGLWKTTNFLTSSPTGPTWIPLLDQAPLQGMTIGGLALVGVNNDPNQTRVFVATGDGRAVGDPERPSGTTSRGIGFLRSLNGGATWELLDSTNNNLPFAQRNHFFAAGNGTTAFRLVADPKLTPGGQVILYAAMADLNAAGEINYLGTRGGLWRSLDSGTTWTRLRAGQASDVVLDPLSGTGSPDGSLQFLYAAFQNDGIYFSNNRGDDLLTLPGGVGKPLVQNIDFAQPQPTQAVTPLTPGTTRFSPNTYGAPPPGFGTLHIGRIQLVKPAPTGDTLKDAQYRGWMYASVQLSIGDKVEDFPPPLPNSSLYSLFMTKDFGQNWTRVLVPDVGLPTNFFDPNDVQIFTPSADPTGSGTPGGGTPYFWGNFSSALAVDPNDPNVIYFGGAKVFGGDALLRINTTGIADPHAFYLSNDDTDQDPTEGMLRTYAGYGDSVPLSGMLDADESGNPLTLFKPIPFAPPPYNGPYNAPLNLGGPNFNVRAFDPIRTPFLNLIRNPNEPFAAGATVLVHGVGRFNNAGTKSRWTPFDIAAKPDPFDNSVGNNPNDPGTNTWSRPTRGFQRILTVRDPLTGGTRLYIANDNGVYTAVDQGDGSLIGSIGFVVDPTTTNGDVQIVNGSRNGNLQIAQFRAGASQPTALSAQLAVLRGLFMGNGEEIGQPISDAFILEPGQAGYGNIQWISRDNRESGWGIATQQNFNVITDAGGVQRPSVANSNVYQFETPAGLVAADFPGDTFHPATDFFQVNNIGRTFGLVQTQNQGNVPDAQWPFRSEFTFAVNPLNGNQIVIGSAAGRVFRTETAGTVWAEIARPGIDVDTSIATAFAYGAPERQDPTNLGDFIYVGKTSGNIYVTRTGGAPWRNISNGLDGSPVRSIVTNPTRGSFDAYAVTQGGVFYNPDIRAANTSWTNITGNLFDLTRNPLGQPGLIEPRLQSITSLAADYRYAIPDDLANPTGPSHPILYVAGDSGVFRSLDKGKNWSVFPARDPLSFDNTPVPPGDGGGLPAVLVTDLDLVLGAIDPTNGRPQGLVDPDRTPPGGVDPNPANNALSPNVLMATTYGRGAFAIRLAPVTLADSLRLSPTLPAPGGSDSGSSANDAITNVTTPTITGFSQQTAFGNIVRVRLLQLEPDPNNPGALRIARPYIGGWDGTSATDTLANRTNETGLFNVQVNPGVFAADGSSDGQIILGVQTFDQAGTPGNIAIFQYRLDTTAPAAPNVPDLQAASDTGASNTDNITSDRTPTFDIGNVEPGATVALYRNGILVKRVSSLLGGIVSITDDVLPGPGLPDGAYVYTAEQTDVAGNTGPRSAGLTIIVPDTPPTDPNSPDLVGVEGPGQGQEDSDTGISDTDNITADNTPTFRINQGTSPAGQTIQLRRRLVGSGISTLVGTVTTSGWITETNPIADGVYEYFTRRNGIDSASLIVTIDTTIAQLLAPDLQPTSDTGASNTDNITSVTSPTFDIAVVEPGAIIRLFRQRVGVDPQPVLARTITSVLGGTVAVQDLGPLVDGDYDYTVEQTDPAGNTSPISPVLRITVQDGQANPPSRPDLTPGSDTGRSNSDDYTQASVDRPPVFNITTAISSATVQLLRKPIGAPDDAYIVVNTRIGPGLIADPGPSFPSFAVFEYAARQITRIGSIDIFSAISPSLTVTIDNIAPGTLGAPDLLDSSDTGISSTDNITADNTPTFQIGGLEPNALVSLLRNGVIVFTSAPVGPDGVITLTDPGAPDGTHLYRLVQEDLAGNVSPLGTTLQVIIDTIPPPAPTSPPDLVPTSDTGASSIDNITSDTSPEFTVSFSLPPQQRFFARLLRRPAGVGSYAEVAQTILVGPFATTTSQQLSVTDPAVTDGDGIYEYVFQLVDLAGNPVNASGGPFSPALTVTIDTTPPPVPTDLDLQDSSDTGISNTDNITNLDTNLQFTVTGVVLGSNVELYRTTNGTRTLVRRVLSSAANTTGGTMTISDPGPVPEGEHTYSVLQVDPAGNPSGEAPSPALLVTIDRTAPIPPAIPDLEAVSDTGSSDTDNITNAATLEIRLSGAGTGNSIQLFRVGSPTPLGTLPADGVLPVSGLPEGVYRLFARAVDVAGNSSLAGPELVVTIDRTPPGRPSAPDLQAASDTGGNNSDNITSLTSNLVFDLTGVESNALVELLRDGLVVANRTGAGPITDPGPVSQGVRAYTVRQTDLAGNVATQDSPVLSVTIDPTLPNAPDAPDLDATSDTGISNVDNLTNALPRQFLLTGVPAGLTAQLLRNGAVVATRVGPGAVTDPDAVADGLYIYQARVLSALGNAGLPSAPLAVTIDRTPPNSPAAPDLQAESDTGTSAIDNLTARRNPTFNVSGVPVGMTVELLRDGSVVASRVGPGPITDPGPVPDGVFTYSARNVDDAGNSSIPGPNLFVTIDGTPNAPRLILLPADDLGIKGDNRTSARRPRLTGSADPGATIDLIDASGRTLASTTADTNGAFTLQPQSNLPVGLSSLQARARDLAGNVGTGEVLPLFVSPLAPADYDGDGKSDFGVYGYNPSAGSGRFLIERSANSLINQPFGGPADFPVVGDFDGDGITDIGTYGYSPAEGFARFAVILSTGGVVSQPFGGPYDVPMAGDYDGDGKTDLAVYGFSPANGFTRFAVLLSGGPNAQYPAGNITQIFGGPADVPMAGDYDGDGKTDLGVYGFSPANGFSRFAILLSGGPNAQYPAGNITLGFGGFDDAPMVGDYDGDGKSDLAVYGFSPANGFSRFAVLLSAGPSTQYPAGNITQGFGGLEDFPIGADYDGDGKTDLAVYGYSRFAAIPTSGQPAFSKPFGTTGDIGLPPSPSLFAGVGTGGTEGGIVSRAAGNLLPPPTSDSGGFRLASLSNPLASSTNSASSTTESTSRSTSTLDLGKQAARFTNTRRNNKTVTQGRGTARRQAPPISPIDPAAGPIDQASRDHALTSALNRLGRIRASRLLNRPRQS